VLRSGALAELRHAAGLVNNLSPSDWSRRSVIEAWTIGQVVAHLALFLSMYRLLLRGILSAHGSSVVAGIMGQVTDVIMPAAAPTFDVMNSVLPKVVCGLFPSEALVQHLLADVERTRRTLLRGRATDRTARACFEGGPYPPSFYVGVAVNELAIHAWASSRR
jgi:hypothetical protein